MINRPRGAPCPIAETKIKVTSGAPPGATPDAWPTAGTLIRHPWIRAGSRTVGADTTGERQVISSSPPIRRAA